VQSLGRVLRRLPEGAGKRAEMHIIYVAGTVDEVIYGKENWSDLTGEAQNNYWLWQHESEQPLEQGGPPREPLPTEEEEWARLGAEIRQPQPWFGAWPDHEYSVDTHGTVTNAQGSVIANSQHVAEMIEGVRRRPGGRFWVTPRHRYVLVQKDSEGLHVAGRLAEPFQVREEGASLVSVEELSSGGTYPGPTEESGGTYRLRQTKGGVIERKTSARSKEFALTEGSGDTGKEANARRLLDAWRGLAIGGLEFYVNALGHAWFRLEGVPKFLADVKDGFRWPSKEG